MNCTFAGCAYIAPDQDSLDRHIAFMKDQGDSLHGGVVQPLNDNQLAEIVIPEASDAQQPEVVAAADNPPVTPADPQPNN